MPGGMLGGGDWERLEASARRSAAIDPTEGESARIFVEIGVHDGRTSRDLISAIGGLGIPFVYVGIDPEPPPSWDHPNYSHIQMPSHLAIGKLQLLHGYKIDWLFIDGCHCAQCVIRDAIRYGDMLSPGCEMCFHDASPIRQGLDPQDYPSMRGYHDEAAARERGIDVRRVLDANLLAGFRLVERAPEDQGFGGVEVYRKL